MRYVVDSVSEGIARLESEDSGVLTLRPGELGLPVKEGDVLERDGEGNWTVLPGGSRERKAGAAFRTALLSRGERRLYVETLGCKVNFYESAGLQKIFGEAGYVPSAMEDADLVILNSCTVTENADRKARAFCRKVRQENPDAVLAVCGCFAQAFPEKAKELGADVLLGTGNRRQMREAVEAFLREGKPVTRILDLRGSCYEHLEAEELLEHTRAFLKIEEGCERYCTYCAIPMARGPVRSLPLEQVKEQAARFAANGYREIVLCGINLSAYGMDLGCDLGDAVLAAASPEEVVRVRLSSLECDILTDGMLDKFASCPKFCPQFHLSLQSGCDRTLRRMNRRYDAGQYAEVCERIRERFENPTFTTDIITGFPGETEEDHRKSVEFSRSIGFLRTHVFPYSRRGGTVAAAMPDQVPRAEKQRRAREMIRELAPVCRQAMEGFVGKKARVILERDEGGWFSGYTDRYLPARVTGSGLAPRMIVEGEILRIEDGLAVLEGKPV